MTSEAARQGPARTARERVIPHTRVVYKGRGRAPGPCLHQISKPAVRGPPATCTKDLCASFLAKQSQLAGSPSVALAEGLLLQGECGGRNRNSSLNGLARHCSLVQHGGWPQSCRHLLCKERSGSSVSLKRQTYREAASELIPKTLIALKCK